MNIAAGTDTTPIMKKRYKISYTPLEKQYVITKEKEK